MMTHDEIKEKERELEEITQKVESYVIRKTIPIFELFATTFSLMLSILLLNIPQMLNLQVYENGEIYDVYGFLLNLAPEYVWALAFFVAAMFKAFGLLFSKNTLRLIGLSLSLLLYAMFSLALLMNFPSILMVLFINLFFFTIVSMPMIRSTSISTKKEKV